MSLTRYVGYDALPVIGYEEKMEREWILSTGNGCRHGDDTTLFTTLPALLRYRLHGRHRYVVCHCWFDVCFNRICVTSLRRRYVVYRRHIATVIDRATATYVNDDAYYHIIADDSDCVIVVTTGWLYAVGLREARQCHAHTRWRIRHASHVEDRPTVRCYVEPDCRYTLAYRCQ